MKKNYRVYIYDRGWKYINTFEDKEKAIEVARTYQNSSNYLVIEHNINLNMDTPIETGKTYIKSQINENLLKTGQVYEIKNRDEER